MFKRFSFSKEVRFEIVVQIAPKFSVQVPNYAIFIRSGNQVYMILVEILY